MLEMLMKINGWDMPCSPNEFYRSSGWSHWGDFLGRGGSKKRTIDQVVSRAEQLAKDNNGLLPKISSLLKIDASLVTCLANHPSKFYHILREAPHKKSHADRILEISELVKSKGSFPRLSEIKAVSPSLASFVVRHPDKVKHLGYETRKKRLSLNDWVQVAKTLVKQNNGSLPSYNEILKSQNAGLLHARTRRPDLFAFCYKPRQRKSFDEGQ